MIDEESLKWFYINWNIEAKKMGISNQFKILPNDDYFKSKIKLQQELLIEEFPLIKKVNFLYINEIDEARKQIASKQL